MLIFRVVGGQKGWKESVKKKRRHQINVTVVFLRDVQIKYYVKLCSVNFIFSFILNIYCEATNIKKSERKIQEGKEVILQTVIYKTNGCMNSSIPDVWYESKRINKFTLWRLLSTVVDCLRGIRKLLSVQLVIMSINSNNNISTILLLNLLKCWFE